MHSKARELIEKCFKRNEGLIYDLTEAMFSIKEKRTFHDKEVLHILERMNIIQPDASRKKNRYRLVPPVDNLINYLINSMESDTESVKYYFVSYFK